MDTDKIKEAVAWVTPIDENFILTTKSLRGIIILRDLATQVIEVSEAMPAKKEYEKKRPYLDAGENWKGGYNQCHDEFVLWLTKKLEGIEKVLIDYCYYEDKGDKIVLDFAKVAQAIKDQILGREK